MNWLVAPNVDLRWRCWNDELVVYHVQSGDTHLLNPIAAQILHALQKNAMSTDELLQSVSRTFELEPNSELVRQVQQALEQFDELGLIEPCVTETIESSAAPPATLLLMLVTISLFTAGFLLAVRAPVTNACAAELESVLFDVIPSRNVDIAALRSPIPEMAARTSP